MARLSGDKWLTAMLFYGGGLRLLETLRLRGKNLDIERGEITVREGKEDPDRATMTPREVIRPLQKHLRRVRVISGRRWRMVTSASNCRTLCPASIPMPSARGAGSFCSHSRIATANGKPDNKAAITSTNRRSHML
jgi:integrase